MFKGIWMKQSSPYKDPCGGIKIHSKEAIDNAEKIAQGPDNKYLCMLCQGIWFLSNSWGRWGVKIFTEGETKADLCFRMKIKHKKIL